VKFLTDVNASGVLARWLLPAGHDVLKVGDKNPRMPDDEILVWAVAENRIIITTDNDFEEMIWREKRQHCDILRLQNVPRLERQKLLEDALQFHHRDLSAGAIVIAQKNKFRIRH
jgi:predicted nuclease of predicted toxin-antitoxin system